MRGQRALPDGRETDEGEKPTEVTVPVVEPATVDVPIASQAVTSSLARTS